MQRITITIDDALLAEIDQLIATRGYPNRSEAIRDLARDSVKRAALGSDPAQDCVAALVYVYDHERRELPRRLTHAAHDHHHLSISTLHVHLDHDHCLEVNVLKGSVAEVQHFGDHVIAERGVEQGQLVMLPMAKGLPTSLGGTESSGPTGTSG